MDKSLFSLLKTLAPFENHELEMLAPKLKIASLKKGEFFSKAGLITDRIGYVNSGLLRSFYDIKGKETTTFFLQEGTFAVAFLSYLQMQPAVENIQAIEDSELIIIGKKDLTNLYEGNWKWQQVGRVLIEEFYIKMEQRSITLQSQSAQERYETFLTEFPGVIKYVPLQQVASFLGISPETLSRIRKAK